MFGADEFCVTGTGSAPPGEVERLLLTQETNNRMVSDNIIMLKIFS